MNIMVAMAETVDPGDSFTSNSYSVMRLGASWDLKFEESLALTLTMNSNFYNFVKNTNSKHTLYIKFYDILYLK